MESFKIAYLNSNNGHSILAFGKGEAIRIESKSVEGNSGLNQLEQFIQKNNNSYLFGYLSYDLKNEIHNLSSHNIDSVEFPLIYFWKPQYVVEMKNENFSFVQGEKCQESFDFVQNFLEEETDQNFHPYNFNFKPRISKEEYIEKVNSLKSHIQLGNCYEVNFCQEFIDDNIDLNFTLDAYFKLNSITKAPYSIFFQHDELTVIGGSPERFIKKHNLTLSSEPIKGTKKRGQTEEEDNQLINDLKNDPKERSENVMIVDLVRNDLSKIASKNSVKVDELCEIYSYETVHQMISKISCEIEPSVKFTDIIKATFPMGSMTGAPKKRVMELIEEHESFSRGLYSGTIGYIKPNGDFDFNVVIRTLLYNKKNKNLSCSVGSAITILSDPEKEYEECFVKVKRILDGMNE
jgi:para-aminobenzoate synthetase component 1